MCDRHLFHAARLLSSDFRQELALSGLQTGRVATGPPQHERHGDRQHYAGRRAWDIDPVVMKCLAQCRRILNPWKEHCEQL